ncbi:hypothetical protein [Candidatus Nitrososphaera sp. FF02]|uniref:hypothetical protein n=1 Tax=Candidatus Nitrososphaera sp. FF02 TaxID=3398226 RepID=UPI0039ECA73F
MRILYVAIMVALLMTPAAEALAERYVRFNRLQLSDPVLSVTSSELKPVSAGDQVVIANTIHNNHTERVSFFLIVEVRDADGFTTNLNWINGNVDAGKDIQIGVSWMPAKAGQYTLDTFALESITDPVALSQIAESRVDIA